VRAAVRKNESSRFAFFPYRKGGGQQNLKGQSNAFSPWEKPEILQFSMDTGR
jgi:hypothetical protein